MEPLPIATGIRFVEEGTTYVVSTVVNDLSIVRVPLELVEAVCATFDIQEILWPLGVALILQLQGVTLAVFGNGSREKSLHLGGEFAPTVLGPEIHALWTRLHSTPQQTIQRNIERLKQQSLLAYDLYPGTDPEVLEGFRSYWARQAADVLHLQEKDVHVCLHFEEQSFTPQLYVRKVYVEPNDPRYRAVVESLRTRPPLGAL